MRKGSGLSAGELVTYQLYFNKIQSSYNQLVNLLSSFTPAGGAAQRVLGLLKAMPSTDAGGAVLRVCGCVTHSGARYSGVAEPPCVDADR